MNLNKVIIAGRVTAQPELRTTTGGQSVVGFSIATNRVWTDKSGTRQEDTEFHNIVAWGRQAEIASQFLTKGSLTLVEGRLQTRTWQDKQGQQRKTTDIICERLQLGPRPAGSGTADFVNKGPSRGAESPSSQAAPAAEEIPTINLEEESKQEDLPF